MKLANANSTMIALTGADENTLRQIARAITADHSVDMMEPFIERVKCLVPAVDHDHKRTIFGNRTIREFAQEDRDNIYKHAPTMSAQWLARTLTQRDLWLVYNVQTAQEYDVLMQYNVHLFRISDINNFMSENIFDFVLREADELVIDTQEPHEVYNAAMEIINTVSERFAHG